MKRIKLITFICLMIISTFFIGCKKEDVISNSNDSQSVTDEKKKQTTKENTTSKESEQSTSVIKNEDGTISAVIDGEEVKLDEAESIVENDDGSVTYNMSDGTEITVSSDNKVVVDKPTEPDNNTETESNKQDDYSYSADPRYQKYEYAYENNDTSALTGDELTFYANLKECVDNALVYSDIVYQEKSVHDWICNHTVYDHEALSTGPYAHLAEGVFIDGRAVCQGYAYAFKLCMDLLGIDNDFASAMYGNEGHIWNVVKLPDNNWYQVDVTWDDGWSSSPVDGEKHYVRYYCFNITEERHGTGSGRYECKYTCNSTKYNYAYFDEIKFAYDDASFYSIIENAVRNNIQELDIIVDDSVQNLCDFSRVIRDTGINVAWERDRKRDEYGEPCRFKFTYGDSVRAASDVASYYKELSEALSEKEENITIYMKSGFDESQLNQFSNAYNAEGQLVTNIDVSWYGEDAQKVEVSAAYFNLCKNEAQLDTAIKNAVKDGPSDGRYNISIYLSKELAGRIDNKYVERYIDTKEFWIMAGFNDVDRNYVVYVIKAISLASFLGG